MRPCRMLSRAPELVIDGAGFALDITEQNPFGQEMLDGLHDEGRAPEHAANFTLASRISPAPLRFHVKPMSCTRKPPRGRVAQGRQPRPLDLLWVDWCGRYWNRGSSPLRSALLMQLQCWAQNVLRADPRSSTSPGATPVPIGRVRDIAPQALPLSAICRAGRPREVP